MHQQFFQLISGVNAVSATGAVEVLGMELFTAGFFASGIGSPATGSLTLQGRLNQIFPYATIFSGNLTTLNTGFYTQFSGPYESLQAIMTSTTGVYSVIVAAGYHSN